jgi:hypothetical protein
MTDENADLGRRLALAGVPIDLPGALVVTGEGLRGRWLQAHDHQGRVAASGFLWGQGVLTHWPDGLGEAWRLDLLDGATRGAVLGWLRETYGQFNLCARFVNLSATTVSWWCFSPNVESLDDLPHGDSEAEALVVAAEWLREGRWAARSPRKAVAPPKPRQALVDEDAS